MRHHNSFSIRHAFIVLMSVFLWSHYSLMGCSTECSEGTHTVDGRCVKDAAKACGPGTTLIDKTCQIDASSCHLGTTLIDGACAPDSNVCAQGTSFDIGVQRCIPDFSIVCGQNTLEQNGICIPNIACDSSAMLNAQGLCVVSAHTCALGTRLEPTTNTCVLDEGLACAPGTIFSQGKCKVVDDVCGDDTFFSETQGVCVPEARCAQGDVILEGLCVRPAQALFKQATTRFFENDDPTLDGNPNIVTLPSQGTQAVFSGVIDTPIIYQNKPHQDVDYFTTELTQGQWIRVSVQSLEGPSLTMMFTNPDGVERQGPILGTSHGSARQFLVTKTGTYTFRVLPAISQISSKFSPIGDPSWSWVGTIEEIHAPTPSTITRSTPLQGHLLETHNNLYTFQGSGEVVSPIINNLAPNAKAMLVLWQESGHFLGTFHVSANETPVIAIPSGTIYLFIDWLSVEGHADNFEMQLQDIINLLDLGPVAPETTTKASIPFLFAGKESYYYSVDLMQGQVFEVTHLNSRKEELFITILSPDGSPLIYRQLSDPSNDPSRDPIYAYAKTTGRYIIGVENSSSSSFSNYALNVRSITPKPLSMLTQAGDRALHHEPLALAKLQRDFFIAHHDTSVLLSGQASSKGLGNPIFRVYDENYIMDQPLVLASESANHTFTKARFKPGTLIFEITAFSALSMGYMLDVTLEALIETEQEPNDTPDMANTLKFDTLMTGELNANDTDLFTITIPQTTADKTAWHVSMNYADQHDDANAEFNCAIADSDGRVLHAAQGMRRCNLLLKAPAPGTYIITLHSAQTASYDLHTTLTPGFVEVEPNSMETDATPLSWDAWVDGAPVYGESTSSTDQDTFSFTIPTGLSAKDTLVLELLPLDLKSTRSMSWKLIDPQGLILSSKNIGERIYLSDIHTLGGLTFSLAITRTKNDIKEDGLYVLSAALEHIVLESEPNDTLFLATPIPSIPHTIIGTGGQVGTPIDEPSPFVQNATFDHYTFTLEQTLKSDETLTITLKATSLLQPSTSLIAFVYDSTGYTIAHLTKSGISKSADLTNLKAGTYSIGVGLNFVTAHPKDYAITLSIN